MTRKGVKDEVVIGFGLQVPGSVMLKCVKLTQYLVLQISLSVLVPDYA